MLTRNSIVWVIGMAAGALGFLVSNEGWLPASLLAHKDWIELAAVAIGGASAALRQSPLPHSASSDQTIEFSRVMSDPPAPIVRSANR